MSPEQYRRLTSQTAERWTEQGVQGSMGPVEVLFRIGRVKAENSFPRGWLQLQTRGVELGLRGISARLVK